MAHNRERVIRKNRMLENAMFTCAFLGFVSFIVGVLFVISTYKTIITNSIGISGIIIIALALVFRYLCDENYLASSLRATQDSTFQAWDEFCENCYTIIVYTKRYSPSAISVQELYREITWALTDMAESIIGVEDLLFKSENLQEKKVAEQNLEMNRAAFKKLHLAALSFELAESKWDNYFSDARKRWEKKQHYDPEAILG